MSNSNTNLPTQTSSVLQNDTVSSCSISKVQEKTQLLRIKCMNSLRAIQSQLKFLIETLQDFGNMPIFKRTFSQDLDLLENHLTQEIISQIDCKTTLIKLITTFENALSSKIKACAINQTSKSLPVSKSSRVTITAVPKADHSKSSSSFSDSKQFVCSICHKCVFNANHNACITKLLKEANSRAKIQSRKTRNSNKPVDQKSHTQKPGRQIFTGHRFFPNKTSAVCEKTYPRSDLRWKTMGRIFKSVSLRWIPTGKLFDSCTSKVDSEPPHGSNVDILNIYECKQTLDVSAGISINVQKEQSLDLSAGTLCNVNKENLRVWLLCKNAEYLRQPICQRGFR
ncbi:hypothetical protein Tco_0369014 [Tanacetum coccineum]